MAMRPVLAASALAVALSLGACQDAGFSAAGSARAREPIPPKTVALMATKTMSPRDPILIRAFKKESEMEVWKRGADGQYALLKTFPICRWSGQLGPKVREGDRQAPEGFYPIAMGQMNPNSSYYLSFDTGYPNAFDRANGRTGSYLMVHGTCSSAGCFAMTDEAIAEIYAIAREAFAGGQRAFQFQSYPFRMTAQNLAKFRNDPNIGFWRNLKEGSDYFETLHEEPRVGVCGTRYVFGGQDAAAGACSPKVDPLVVAKREKDEVEVAELVAKGAAATRLVYQDGGQHPFFRESSPSTQLFAEQAQPRPNMGIVSRPEALAAAPEEIAIEPKVKPTLLAKIDPKHEKGRHAKPTALAFAAPATSPAPIPTREAAAAAPAAPITVASADGDPAAYRKLLGNLFGGAPAAPPASSAALPAADTAPVAAISPAAPLPKKTTAHLHPAPSAHSAAGAKVDGVNPAAAKKAEGKPAEAKPAPRTGDAKTGDAKPAETGKRTEGPNRNRVAAAQPAN
ncbi:L,D-transpeptidase family protein [Methylobacterium terrae]|uniref:L,D-transpeptidase family protein n=1 Tax=Methylobacterium terrae TaxID=2202827 RepID=UPI001FE08ECE|nr:murein L,D-transpeptidase family protein [Methylobacterium terrae]